MSEYEGLQEVLEGALNDADPIPPDLVEMAAGLADWIDPDASLAELVEREQVALRDPSVSQHQFAWPIADLTVQVTGRPTGARVVGLFSADVADRVEVVGPGYEPLTVQTDHGSFEIEIEGVGVFMLRFDHGGTRHITGWMRPTSGSN